MTLWDPRQSPTKYRTYRLSLTYYLITTPLAASEYLIGRGM